MKIASESGGVKSEAPTLPNYRKTIKEESKNRLLYVPYLNLAGTFVNVLCVLYFFFIG